MQKQAPTLGRLLTMVLFALSCFGLLLFLWLSFGGPVPLKAKGYRFKVAVPEAVQLGLEADVRSAGVRVGKVRKKEVDKNHPNRTIATIEVDPRFAPISQDAHAMLRQKTLLGETYLELTPGRPGTPKLKENGSLSPAHVTPTVELDEVIQALDPVTRKAFQGWQQDLAVAAKGRGRDLSDALGNLPQFGEDANDVLAVLDTQSGAVRRLVRNTGVVFGALSENEAQLKNLVVSAGNVFQQTSDQQKALAETFKIFPTFLDESKATFAKLDTFSRNAAPLAKDLKAAGPDLQPTVRNVRLLAPDLERLFTNLDPLITAAKTGLPALRDVLGGAKPLLGQLQPFLENLNPILQWIEYNQSVTSDFISNGAGALSDTVPVLRDNERGHYLRQFGPLGLESAAMWPNRPSVARGNAYPMPTGFGTGPLHAKYMMFPNFDCNNTGAPGDGTKDPPAPDTGEKPPNGADPACWIAPVSPFPAGNTRKFPHIEKLDYSKK
jgi:phospholipid/cholesterol/gamma-HCH transport system substrate-binding protein